MLLTVGVLSVLSRLDRLAALLGDLSRQADGLSAEILCLFDNKRRTIGAKRNAMLDIARGRFIMFVDDDDRVEPDYVQSVLQAILANPNTDCVVFDVLVHIHGQSQKVCKYGVELSHGEDGGAYYRLPNHVMCHRVDIARRFPYQDISYGEDDIFAAAIRNSIGSQIRIPKILYHYQANESTSEAIKHRR